MRELNLFSTQNDALNAEDVAHIWEGRPDLEPGESACIEKKGLKVALARKKTGEWLRPVVFK